MTAFATVAATTGATVEAAGTAGVVGTVGAAPVPLSNNLAPSQEDEGHDGIDPSTGHPRIPRVARTRSNLTALSQRYNVSNPCTAAVRPDTIDISPRLTLLLVVAILCCVPKQGLRLSAPATTSDLASRVLGSASAGERDGKVDGRGPRQEVPSPDEPRRGGGSGQPGDPPPSI